jgi:hypothetical protein
MSLSYYAARVNCSPDLSLGLELTKRCALIIQNGALLLGAAVIPIS